MMVTKSMRSPLYLLLAAAALSSCSSTSVEEVSGPSVSELIIATRYEEALTASVELIRIEPSDDNLKQHKRATIAWLMDQGRRLTFAGSDEEALHTFEQALLLEPTSTVVLTWVGKTRSKIATNLFETAFELHGSEQYVQAKEKYIAALEMDPNHEGARRGKELAERQSTYRVDLAQSYYVDGVRALTDYWLEQAKSRFGYTRKYLPEHVRALDRESKVDGMLADQRMTLGDDYMTRGLYAAARNEYRLAEILGPSTVGVAEKLERATLEALAGEHLLEAELFIFKGDFESALASLDAGGSITERQTAEFDAVRAEVDGERNRLIYERALAYEHDYLYQRAIKVYDKLLSRTDYYEDSRARRETLIDYVSNAERLYRAAEASEDPTEELSLLRQIEIFWPEFLDVQERISLLEGASD